MIIAGVRLRCCHRPQHCAVSYRRTRPPAGPRVLMILTYSMLSTSNFLEPQTNGCHTQSLFRIKCMITLVTRPPSESLARAGCTPARVVGRDWARPHPGRRAARERIRAVAPHHRRGGARRSGCAMSLRTTVEMRDIACIETAGMRVTAGMRKVVGARATFADRDAHPATSAQSRG